MVTRNKLISLFCGPGGFDVGFQQAGFETRLAIDKDLAAVRTHRRNHESASAIMMDLTQGWAVDFIWDQCKVRFDDQDPPVGIIGGPPCQSFSVGNAHKKEDDPRHDLPGVYASIIVNLNERFRKGLDFFVFENVPGLRNMPQYDQFKERMAGSNFAVFESALDAQFMGVPQMRRRLFIVGINKKRHRRFARGATFEFPKENQPFQACGPVLGRIEKEAVVANSGLSPHEVKQVAGHVNHWCMEPKSDKFNGRLVEHRLGEKVYRTVEVAPDKELGLARLMGGKSFKVLDPQRPSYTVAYGHREVHLHPKGHRRLSVYEALQLQGFPEEYELLGNLSDQIRLVSEVVAPPVAHQLALAIRNQLGLVCM